MMGGAPMGRNYPAGRGARGPRSARPQSTPAMASTSRRDQDPERRLIAPSRIPDQPDQGGAEREARLARGAHHPEDGAEGVRAELLAGQDRGQRDHVPHGQPDHQAARVQNGRGRARRHRRERGGLDPDIPGGEDAGIPLVGEEAEAQAPDQGGHRRGTHRERGPRFPQRRGEQADLVDDEPDLRGQRQRERHGDGPEERRREGLPSRPLALGRGGPRSVAECAAVTAWARIGRRGLDDERHERQEEDEEDRARGDHGGSEAQALNADHEGGHDHHAADARAGQRQRHRQGLAAAEPRQQCRAEARRAEAGPARREQYVHGEELPQRGDLPEQSERARHRADPVGEHAPRTVPVDQTADRDDQRGADQIVDRHRHRDGPGGPAMEAHENVQVDAEAVEGESPGEARDGRARGDDVPTVVGRGHGSLPILHAASLEINRPQQQFTRPAAVIHLAPVHARAVEAGRGVK